MLGHSGDLNSFGVFLTPCSVRLAYARSILLVHMSIFISHASITVDFFFVSFVLPYKPSLIQGLKQFCMSACDWLELTAPT